MRPQLLERLELVRQIHARPIRIVSGYRCPVHNAAVGGARDSQHMYAAAADVPRGSFSLDDAVSVGFTGVGLQGGVPIHVDVRDGPLTTWAYPSH